jgi:hypothetical protein
MYILFNYLENRRTCGETLSNIQSAFHFSLQLLFEKFFFRWTFGDMCIEKHVVLRVKSPLNMSDRNENSSGSTIFFKHDFPEQDGLAVTL